MNFLIVEDDYLAAERLQQIVVNLDPKYCVLEVLHSVADTKNWLLSNKTPCTIFLDIQLSDGISFEIFDDQKLTHPIIFITAFNNYAIKAFNLNSVDYILKPYKEEAIANAITKLRDMGNSLASINTKSLLLDIEEFYQKKYKTRFFVKAGTTAYSITVNEIMCFKTEYKGTFLSLYTNRSFLIPYSLDALEEVLDPLLFFRINRNYIINFESIKKMQINSKSRIQLMLNDDTKHWVSRAKNSAFRKWIDQ